MLEIKCYKKTCKKSDCELPLLKGDSILPEPVAFLRFINIKWNWDFIKLAIYLFFSFFIFSI